MCDFFIQYHIICFNILKLQELQVVTKKVAPIGIGLTAELLELIDTQRSDLSRSLFVRRIIQDYYRWIEQEKESSVNGKTRFVSVSQKPTTKVVRNQTTSKLKK